MTAVYLPHSTSVLPAWTFVLGLALTVLSLVLIRRELGRLPVSVALIALLMAGPLALPISAEDDEFVMLNRCKQLEPWSWEWIALGCFYYSDDPPPQEMTTTTAPTTTQKPQPTPERKR